MSMRTAVPTPPMADSTLLKRPALTTVVALAIVIAAIITLIAYLKHTESRITLREKLEQEVRQLFPIGSSRENIENWTKSQPAIASTFQKFEANTDIGRVIDKLRLKGDAVATVIRLDYDETRWPDQYKVFLYFCFDQNDQLVGHYVAEQVVSF
jgi:hypothetical protein